MESIIPAILIISLLLLAALVIVDTSLTTQDDVMMLWQEVEERSGERARTAFTAIGAEASGNGSNMQITLRNDGSTRLADFEAWDIVLQYYTAPGNYEIEWYPYSEGVGMETWTIIGIYEDAASLTSEAFEPGIFNPGEEMVLRVTVSPPVGPNTINQASLSSEYGIRATTVITR